MFRTTSNIVATLRKSINGFHKYDISSLLDLNQLIHSGTTRCEYHLHHIQLTAEYASRLADRLAVSLDRYKLKYAALAHDLLKEKEFDKNVNEIERNGINIPQNLNWYVRTNLDVLEKYNLDLYFNTDVQLHALASGIFVHNHFGITDPEVLYPIFFHSCPIIPVYENLNPYIQLTVDIMMLSDKLSSNKIKRDTNKSSINLEQAVFGESGKEFNFTLGLLLARLIAQGNSNEKHSILATNYYHERLQKYQPFITEKTLKEMKSWAKK